MALSKQQQNVHAVFAAISATLWFLAFIFFVVIFINFMSRRKHYGLKQKAPLHLATTIFILMIVSAINFMYSRVAMALRHSGIGVSQDIIEIGGTVGAALYIITYALILITFVLRLQYVCNGTQSDYSPYFYIFIYSEVTVMVFAAAAGQTTDNSVIIGVAMVMYIFNCIFLTYLFYRSLKKIMNSTGYENLIRVMVKFFVLVSMCMSLSLVFGIGLIFEGIFDDTDMEEPFTYVVWITQAIDSPFNVAAIYFQFKFADPHYFKFFSKYHNWVGTTIFNIPTYIEQNIEKEMSMDQDTTQAVQLQSQQMSVLTAVETSAAQ